MISQKTLNFTDREHKTWQVYLVISLLMSIKLNLMIFYMEASQVKSKKHLIMIFILIFVNHSTQIFLSFASKGASISRLVSQLIWLFWVELLNVRLI